MFQGTTVIYDCKLWYLQINIRNIILATYTWEKIFFGNTTAYSNTACYVYIYLHEHSCTSLICQRLIILGPNACRIVHISSGIGSLYRIGKAQQDKVLASDLTVDALSALMKQFVM